MLSTRDIALGETCPPTELREFGLEEALDADVAAEEGRPSIVRTLSTAFCSMTRLMDLRNRLLAGFMPGLPLSLLSFRAAACLNASTAFRINDGRGAVEGRDIGDLFEVEDNKGSSEDPDNFLSGFLIQNERSVNHGQITVF